MSDKINHELLKKLGDWPDYWEVFKSDIILRVEYILTEPVCPVCYIEFELDRAPTKILAGCFGNTIEEAINNASKKAIERLEMFRGMTYEQVVEVVAEEERLKEQEIKERQEWIASLENKKCLHLNTF